MAVIAGNKDWPASPVARDLREREAVLVPRLRHVDDGDIVIVLVELLPHFRAGLYHRKEVTLVIEHIPEQIPDVIIILDDQYLANPRHLSPSGVYAFQSAASAASRRAA